MENKINVAELLKDCPKGMELNCAMYNDLYFNQVYDDCLYKISCYTTVDGIRTTVNFTEFGTFNTHENSKCVIFPKGKTTWEGFQKPFKDGDIVATDGGGYAFILKKVISYNSTDVKGTCYFGVELQTKKLLSNKVSWYFSRFATEEEKAELFKAIKENGYKWNEESKSLEKLIEPNFKVGDKIVKKNDVYAPILIANVDNGFYYFNTESSVGMLPISDQDSYELVPNKFDLNTLKPFDKVLVRHDRDNTWCGSLLSHMDGKSSSYCYKFVTTAGKSYPMCIPYKGNEHLLGTANDCDEFYKNWK